MKIRKAVFPVAGLGTRFLPATKAMPKEMLPVVDKPLIQYAVEEALAAGIEQLIFVTGKGKTALEDHYDRSCEIEHTLMARSREGLLKEITSMVPESGTVIYTRQNEPLGLGHAIWCARHIVGDEPFAVLLADDLIKADPPVLAQMVDCYDAHDASVVGLVDVPPEETAKYGIVETDGNLGRDHAVPLCGMVEKPSPSEAPSNLAIIGRYILAPEIFEILGRKERGRGGEIQITDAIARLLRTQAVWGYRFEGTRFDCGDKAGFQMANLAYALERSDLRAQLLPFVRDLVATAD